MAGYERLTAFDASFLEIEDENTHMHVGAILIFDARPLLREDGGLDIERVRHYIESQLHCVPRYRQRIARIPFEKHPVWIDDVSFNLQYHVRHTCLPQPGDERVLKRLAGRIMSQKLDRGKPLWEMWVIEGLGRERFALIAKAHHCMVDGIAGMDVISALLRPAPDPTIEEPPYWQPRPTPGSAQLLAGEVLGRAATPLTIVQGAIGALRHPRGAFESVRDSVLAIGETLTSDLRPAPATPLNPGRIGPHRRFDFIGFDLDHVKQVKNRLGGTVNDIVLATVTGAIGRFLLARGTRVSELDFRAMLPVNIRTQSDRGKLGNRVAMFMASLPVAEPDPRKRLHRIIETTRKLKASKQVRGTEILEEIGDWTSTALITRAVRLAARLRTFNLVVTNVPGPREPLYLLEAPLLASYPIVPIYTNQAVGIGLFSYAGGLYWGINSDWDRVPNLHDLIELLGMEFEKLRKAAKDEAPGGAPRGNPGRQRRREPRPAAPR
jgi:WS/DGAT/MGAT family acyltransferase